MSCIMLGNLPEIRGKYREQADLSKIGWFRVGGCAEVLFRPADTEDLSYFLKHKPDNLPITIIGVGSNIIIRDGGIKGVVIRLGRGFADITADGGKITAGAAALSPNVAKFCQIQSRAGLEFLSGIPGTIGGTLAMNSGAYGSEVSEHLTEAEAVDMEGNIHTIANEDMGFSYRKNSLPDSWIFTKATFQTQKDDPVEIQKRMEEISAKREETQPIRTQTGGSTFKNPSPDSLPEHLKGKKAWQLIDEAGCRGLQTGGAQMSEKHCNFMVNLGSATAADLEGLGEEVRRHVREKFSVELEWEIKRVGEKVDG